MKLEAEVIATNVVYGITPALTDKQEIIDLSEQIKAYGRQCAEQVLKDAADRATCSDASWNAMPKYTVDTDSILDTPIVTP